MAAAMKFAAAVVGDVQRPLDDRVGVAFPLADHQNLHAKLQFGVCDRVAAAVVSRSWKKFEGGVISG